jgi:ankyrin repeat protein
MAAYFGDRGVAIALLERGADCNAVGQGGLTPLHIAVWAGCRAVAGLLLERGADASEDTRWYIEERVGGEGTGWSDEDRGVVDESLSSQVREAIFDDQEGKLADAVSNGQNNFTVQELAALGGKAWMRWLLRIRKARVDAVERLPG